MIESVDALRRLYAQPTERAVRKELDRLDAHCARFIAMSPLVVVASSDAQGHMDASPRGGAPGFVRLLDDRTLLIPDAPGNNRLDTLTNILATGQLGLLFLVPGVDETLRVNGSARLRDEPGLQQHFAHEKRAPRLVIELHVQQAYLHCAKALMRSSLWSADNRIERAALPTMGQMIADQTGAAAETQAQMLARYAVDL